MELKDLSLKEWLLLCRRAESRCCRRLKALVEGLAGADEDLGRLFLDLAGEEADHEQTLARLDEGIPWPGVWSTDEREIERLLEAHLPALREEPAGGLDRDRALETARNIEKESNRFYRSLSGSAPDQETRRFFRTMADREASHLRRLRDA